MRRRWRVEQTVPTLRTQLPCGLRLGAALALYPPPEYFRQLAAQEHDRRFMGREAQTKEHVAATPGDALAGLGLFHGAVRHFGCVGGDLKSLDKAIDKLCSRGVELRVVYEAGPCGLVIDRHPRTSSAFNCSGDLR